MGETIHYTWNSMQMDIFRETDFKKSTQMDGLQKWLQRTMERDLCSNKIYEIVYMKCAYEGMFEMLNSEYEHFGMIKWISKCTILIWFLSCAF